METRKERGKSPCLHKLQKLSKQRNSHIAKSASKQISSLGLGLKKGKIDRLVTENQQLKAQNRVYEEYFLCFHQRMQQQKHQNEQLKQQLNCIKQSRKIYSTDKHSDITNCRSEGTLLHKLSRATKASRGAPPSEYL